MADMPANFPSYAIQYSDTAKESRKELPPEAMLALFDVIDKLAENPDAFPNWTKPISRDGRIRLYTHPKPALQITYEVDEKEHLLYLLHFVAPKVQVTKSVFISYSHKDAAWLTKVKMFLKPLEDQGLVQIWDDTNISPGSEWLEEIKRSLESAQVALFLITQDFLSSQFIGQKEFPVLLDKANNRGCLIFWIAVSSSTVGDTELSRFQAANDPNKPLDTLPEPAQNTVLTDIYNRMKKAIQ
jgi:TIR domain